MREMSLTFSLSRSDEDKAIMPTSLRLFGSQLMSGGLAFEKDIVHAKAWHVDLTSGQTLMLTIPTPPNSELTVDAGVAPLVWNEHAIIVAVDGSICLFDTQTNAWTFKAESSERSLMGGHQPGERFLVVRLCHPAHRVVELIDSQTLSCNSVNVPIEPHAMGVNEQGTVLAIANQTKLVCASLDGATQSEWVLREPVWSVWFTEFGIVGRSRLSFQFFPWFGRTQVFAGAEASQRPQSCASGTALVAFSAPQWSALDVCELATNRRELWRLPSAHDIAIDFDHRQLATRSNELIQVWSMPS